MYIFQAPYGWLVDLINQFGRKKGFELLVSVIERDNVTVWEMSACLTPIGRCSELLCTQKICSIVTGAINKAINYITNVSDEDLSQVNSNSILNSNLLLG